MTLEAQPFTYERWADLIPQEILSHEVPKPEVAAVLSGGHAVAMVDDHGHTVGCGGICSVKDGEAIAWTYIGKDAGPCLTRLVREMRRVLDDAAAKFTVIKTATLDGFEAGQRMLAMLGFKRSGEMVHEGRRLLLYERRMD